MSLNTLDQIETKAANKAVPLHASTSAAISYRKPKNGRLVLLFLVSISVHIGGAMFILWASHQLQLRQKEDETQSIVGDSANGGETRELIVGLDQSREVPSEKPSLIEETDFVETTRQPEAMPVLTPNPKPVPLKPTPRLHGEKIGPTPSPGVLGGINEKGKDNGKPGGQKGGSQGWHTPRGDYPPEAQLRHIQGTVMVTVITNGTGKITSATATGGDPMLQSAARRMALEIWKGPPNSKGLFPVIYRPRR